jgi:glycosyltransferase involved in cell wall biosynthesis
VSSELADQSSSTAVGSKWTAANRTTAFTIGIPILDEADILIENTSRLLRHLDTLGREYEVILGSNGSTDATVDLGREFARRDPRVSFFHISERGVGLAFKEFVSRARHPYLVSVDMDLSIDLGFIGAALDELESHDLVVGSKRVGKQQRTLFRKLGSESFSLATRCLLGLAYDDYSIAAKAYRVDVLRRYLDRIDAGSSYVLEICYLVQRAGGRIAKLPVSCTDLRASKFNLWREAQYKYAHLVRLWWRRAH